MPIGMPLGMLMSMKTTIGVSTKTRDRLAALASRHERTLGEQLDALIDEAEERAYWDDVSAGYSALPIGLDIVVADEYPEYAEHHVGPILADGDHNAPASAPTTGVAA
jgi:hypothetical protein